MGKRDYVMLRLRWDNALRRAEVCGLDRVVSPHKIQHSLVVQKTPEMLAEHREQ
jgi:hypothetical protein